jgi:ADP-heptose:LPS heptosyltransferase
VLLAIPALRALRQAAPRDRLALAAQSRVAGLLETLGVVDRAIDFETLGLDALFEAQPVVRRRQWPARCADDLRRAGRVVAWIGSREPGFVERLTTLVPGSIVAPSVGAARPVWEHLVDTVGASAALRDRAVRRPVEVPGGLVDESRRELVRRGWNGSDRLLLVHPGSGGRDKRWPATGFAAVLERVAMLPRVRIALHQGPADADAVAALPESLTARAIVLLEPALPRLAGLLTHATAFLGNDSGVGHLAAAVGVPAVVLFGAGRLIWRPWAERVEPVVVSPGAEASDAGRVTALLTALLR